jgi:hypothetical protein
MMRKKAVIWICAGVLIVYLFFPIVAGLLQIGRVDGPKIYFPAHHACLYELAFEQRFGYTPRPSIWHERPWFYGMTPRLSDLSEEWKAKWDEIPSDKKPAY